MAKRAPLDEKPFRPLDVSLLNSVIQHGSEPTRLAPPEPVRKESGLALAPTRVQIPLPGARRLEQELRVLYTRQERQSLDRLVSTLAIRLQTQLKASHVIRALTSLILNAEAKLDLRGAERGPLARPANGDVAGLLRFEREIALLISQAIRDAPLP